jgi:hypothetical protein
MEDKQGQPARKKKRASDGSTVNVTANSMNSKPRQKSAAPRMSVSQTHAPNGVRPRQYADASTSRQSISPVSATSPTVAGNSPGECGSIPYRSRQNSSTPRGVYTDSSTQTDHVDNAWYSNPKQKPVVKRSIIPLSRRLLKNRHRLKLEHQPQLATIGPDAQSSAHPPSILMEVDPLNVDDRTHLESPTDARGRHGSIASSTPSVDLPSSMDITMVEAPAIVVGNAIKPPPLWPAITVPGSLSFAVPKSQDLRVQLPPTPSFSMPNMSGTLSGSVTPSSAAGSIAQSPFGTHHFPGPFPTSAINGVSHASPVKATKKLSLSDYKAKRSAMKSDTSRPSAGSSPTIAPAVLKPALSTIEEANAAGQLEGSAITSSPPMEKKGDLMDFTDSNMESAVRSNLPLVQPNGIL